MYCERTPTPDGELLTPGCDQLRDKQVTTLDNEVDTRQCLNFFWIFFISEIIIGVTPRSS